MLKVIADGGEKFPPGDHIDDNGSNYLLLGYVLEKIYERPYADIVARQISSKLALVRTYYAGSGGSTSLESISYQWTPEGWRPETNTDPSITGGDGALISNATDLVSFMDALCAGQVVSPHNVESMRGEDGDRGIGLQPVEIAGVAGFGARGKIESFSAAVYYFPDRRISLAWTSNASRVPMDEILGDVVSAALGEARKAPR
jgi:CubicO group peptidase (beta-lactamase class C family)